MSFGVDFALAEIFPTYTVKGDKLKVILFDKRQKEYSKRL